MIFLLLACGVWNVPKFATHFDLVEVNHLVDEHGEERFTQVIAWTWCHGYTRMHCEGYRIVESWRRTPRGIRFKSEYDHEWGEVNGEFRETWTVEDPEVQNRKIYPTECRQWKRSNGS